MDAVGERKHLAGILHHRNPMSSAIAMLGMYFAYLFFELQVPLPEVDKWLETCIASHLFVSNWVRRTSPSLMTS